MEVGICLIRKEVAQVALQTFVRTSDILVRVVPPMTALNAGLLIDEALPLFVPCVELVGEFFFVSIFERERHGTQFFTGERFRSAGQVLRYPLDLMELADLDGDVLENR